MKRLLTLILGVACFLSVNANSMHNIKFIAKVADGQNGMGTVYATNDKDSEKVYNADSSFVFIETTTEGVDYQFYAYSKANEADGYMFVGWSRDPEGKQIVSFENPIDTVIRTSSEAGTTLHYLYANFIKQGDCEIEFVENLDGTITATDGNQTISGVNGGSISSSERVTFTAYPNEGKKVLGWYYLKEGNVKEYFSYKSTTSSVYSKDVKIYVEYVDEDTPVFLLKEKNTPYIDLNDALDAATHVDGTVVLSNDGILKRGNYTIPQNVTLLIPFDDNYTCYYDDVNAYLMEHPYKAPSVFRTLTLEDGVTLNVEGGLCVSANMIATRGGNYIPCGGVNGKYGMISMNQGSVINLKNGSNLYAWGYIIGEGNVIAGNGSKVYEGFQMTDFRGGTATSKVVGAKRNIFPINQYYVQNIEAYLTLNSGAKDLVRTSIFSSSNGVAEDAMVNTTSAVAFIGEDGLFELSDGSTLTRHYDPNRDRQVYSISGDANLGAISLTLMKVTASSDEYILPLTNNLSIIMESGKLTYSNKRGIALLPDMELIIKPDATLEIGEGNMYVYDSDNWGCFSAYDRSRPLQYSPTRTCMRGEYKDATLNIQGKLINTDKGRLYTTEAGANICCSGGAGSIQLAGAGTEEWVWQAQQLRGVEGNTGIKIDSLKLTPAKLYNYITQDYTHTSSADPGTTYYYVHGQWTTDKTPLDGVLFGDVFKDGKLDDKDFKILLKLVFDKKVTRYDYKNSDVNNDGKYHSIADLAKFIELWNKVKAEGKE